MQQADHPWTRTTGFGAELPMVQAPQSDKNCPIPAFRIARRDRLIWVVSCRSQFSRPVMRVLKERTFAHTTPHPIGAHRLSITQSNLRDWFFRPPVIPRADLTGYRLD